MSELYILYLNKNHYGGKRQKALIWKKISRKYLLL